MNTYKQSSSFLLGSEENIIKLANKDEATVLVISDSHGSYYSLNSIVKEEGENCDALIFCGDGTADIIQLTYDAQTDENFATKVPPVICFIQGNNDYDLFPMKDLSVTKDRISAPTVDIKVPLAQVITIAGHKLFVTHGHRHALYSGVNTLSKAAVHLGCEAALYGHTHVASAVLSSDNILTLNPGSCTRPRNLQPPCFAKMFLKKGKPVSDYSFWEFSPSGNKPYKPSSFFY